ncbi:hypothetical protein SSX86_032446 [Deinandra increscens subsp. villosa]|uniref:Syntaxin N-terminal domain-containing protein n=1 Tax=Deinandra increscens subsp. villosa TaxID=3103831 RepID=A0AAP0C2W8_9ASTR
MPFERQKEAVLAIRASNSTGTLSAWSALEAAGSGPGDLTSAWSALEAAGSGPVEATGTHPSYRSSIIPLIPHKTRLHIGQLVKDTSEKLKQASETDHRAEVSASKKITDAKLAKDFQAVLKEFQKAQRLAAERETAYSPSIPQPIHSSRNEDGEMDSSSGRSPEQRALLYCNHLVEFALQFLLEELNVKSVVPCNDPLKYSSLRAEPDFSVLGKRLGKSMRVVAEAVKAMSQEDILSFEKTGEITIASHCLKLSDIKIVRGFKRPSGDVLVIIDLQRDDSLFEAGFAREEMKFTCEATVTQFG